MTSDEQRVRTMCGWIGVEISRSRVRTPEKAGYGLYRVRTAAERHWHVPHPKVEPDGEWTAYAFTLDDIERAAGSAIQRGTPSRPGEMLMCGWIDGRGQAVTVSTRWTSAYRGRRDLGCGSVEGELAGWDEMRRPPVGEGLTVRQRQRAANAEFQAAHLERRRYGKARYHAMRLANAQPVDLPVRPDEH